MAKSQNVYAFTLKVEVEVVASSLHEAQHKALIPLCQLDEVKQCKFVGEALMLGKYGEPQAVPEKDSEAWKNRIQNNDQD